MIPTLDQMRQERSQYIGASDIGGLLLDHDGHPIHPYSSPHEVWLYKTGRKEFEESERTEMGLMLEPVIAQRFQMAQPDVKIRRVGTVQATGKRAQTWHRCNPDRLVLGKVRQVPGTSLVEKHKDGLSAIFQMKSAGYFGAQDFGVDGTDEVPDWYLAQVQWELYCTGRDLAILGLLYDTHLYRQYLIYRDDALINTLINVADRFWANYILNDAEPPVTGHDADKSWLQTAWAPKNEERVLSTPEIEADVAALSNELGHQERLNKIIEGRKSRIKAFMGEAGYLDTTLGQIRWKANKNGTRSLLLSQIKATSTSTEKSA